MRYKLTLKYQDGFYASRRPSPDFFTALGRVLDAQEHTAIQGYQVRALAADEGAPTPPETAVAPDRAVRETRFQYLAK